MATHVVTSAQLNLRRTANPDISNIVAVLPQGTAVTRVGGASRPGWWEIDAHLPGGDAHGFVNSSFLKVQAAPSFPVAAPLAGRVKAASLGKHANAKRRNAGAWAYEIGEAGIPGPARQHPGGPAAGIRAVIDWLQVEDSAHRRWWPVGQTTYCNIYSHDVCVAAGAYLPRVWWTGAAYSALKSGQQVSAQYGTTVNEINANSLFNWLSTYGPDYGWVRVYDLDTLQAAANAGNIALTVAQRTDLNRSGHIQIIAPEHGNFSAVRTGGRVTQPLQSNAGTRNFRYGQLGTSWWKGSQFRESAFWINALN